MHIPQDPFLLLSYINTKLRDEYSTLTDLCQSLMLDQNHIEEVLSSIHYVYDKKLNHFIAEM